MPHEHILLPDARAHRLVQFRVRTLEGELSVDVHFENAKAARTHLCFIEGVTELRVEKFKPDAIGYALRTGRNRTVALVPPRGHGLAIKARAVMSVD